MKHVLVLYVCVLLSYQVDSAKILGIFHIPSPSHYILGSRLMKALAERGHQVTSINTFPQDKPVANFRDIPITNIIEIAKTSNKNFLEKENQNPLQQIHELHSKVASLTDFTLQENKVKTFLRSTNETFDLLIMEMFVNEAFLGIAHHFDCPAIILSTMGLSSWTNSIIGNPAPYSYVPNLFLSYSDRMTFHQRVINTLLNTGLELYFHFYYYPFQNKILHKHFPNAPDLWTLMHSKVALILLNSHISTNAPVPHMPNAIDVGGFHLEKSKPLPKPLRQFMDEATEGVIYFSMGSNIKGSLLPAKVRDEILKVFSKLPYKVLWKWETDSLPGQPKNVKLGKWFPQQDILAHPNTKLFITHGGLLSTIESVYYGVPFVGIPIFGDQRMNVATAVLYGYCLGLPFKEVGEKTLSKALNEVLNNPKYTENVKKRSALMKDRPIPPLETAMFWVEHVLRHKGGDHLKSGVLDLQWYQYLLLDVVGFLILALVVPIYLLFVLIGRLCCKSSPGNEKCQRSKKKTE